MQPRTVLIVEDNPITRKVFRLALEGEGFRVFEAEDEASALAAIPVARPDLLILDHVLPRMAGIELLAQLRAEADTPGLPALLVTSAVSPLEAERAHADPAVSVLPKPIEPSRLVAAVRARLAPAPAPGADLGTALPDQALLLLRELAQVLSQPVDVFQAAGEVVLHLLDAAGLSPGLLYQAGPDGRLRLLGQTGLAEPARADAEAGFERPRALAALAFADGAQGFLRGDPDIDADLQHVFEGLGRRWVLAVPVEREGDHRGLVVLASDDRDLTQPAWLAFARHLATEFARTVALGGTLARLREMTDNLHEVVWLRSPDRSRVLYVNAAYEGVFGQSAESLRQDGDSWLELVHPEDRTRVADVTGRSLTGPVDVTFRILHPSGGVRWIRSRLVPSLTSSGEISLYTGIAEDVTAAKEAEARLRAAHNDLEALSRRLVHVQEEERRTLARELHDEFGQALTSLKLNLEVGTRTGEAPDLGELAAQVAQLLERVQNLSLDLRPPMLDEHGLVAALAWHCERFEKQTGIRVEFQYTGMDHRCSPGTEITAFRIIQEALTNVARHASIRTARVRLCANQERIEIEIADEGQGFDPARPGGPATGLTGMRERALLTGGTLRVESVPGRGTTIHASLPRRRAEAPARPVESS